jgi:putative heme-binding domain-containing protein
VINAAGQSQNQTHAELLQSWRESLSNSPLAEFAMALYGGDVQRGEQLYRGHVSAQCVRCHDAGGSGKQAGPELVGIASRVTREHLLESLINPNAKIAEGYSTVTFGLNDGRVLSGAVLTEDSSQVTIGTQAGKTITFAKGEIAERSTSSVSAMPDMTKVLKPTEVRDIIAYLATLRRE